MNAKRREPAERVTRIPLVAAMLLTLAVLILVLWQVSAKPSPDASSHGEDILDSQYSLFQGQVYVSSSGDGSYIVPGADVHSFKPLQSRYDGYSYGYALGRDTQAVYCGDQIVPGLLPEAVHTTFGGYLSDGQHAWFCGRPEDSPDYHWWQELLLSHRESDPERVKRYRFPLVPIEHMTVAALHPVFAEYVSDDRHLFYRGRLIAGSNGRDARPLTYQSHGERKAFGYLRDAQAVYYNGEPLPGVKPDNFSVFDVENDPTIYGLDAASGRYWLEGAVFPDTTDGVDARNLRLLLADRTHAYHDLFANAQGIFYWDYSERRLRHACSLPTAPRLRPVKGLASVFSDGQSLYVVSAHESWGQTRSGRRLLSRNTRLYRLVGVDPNDLQHTGEVRNGRGRTIGDLWQAGATILLEPQAGTGHGYDDALYLISDLQKFQSTALNPDNHSISKLLRENTLEPVVGDKVCDAETENDSDPMRRYFWFAMMGLAAVGLLANVLHRRRASKT